MMRAVLPPCSRSKLHGFYYLTMNYMGYTDIQLLRLCFQNNTVPEIPVLLSNFKENC